MDPSGSTTEREAGGREGGGGGGGCELVIVTGRDMTYVGVFLFFVLFLFFSPLFLESCRQGRCCNFDLVRTCV